MKRGARSLIAAAVLVLARSAPALSSEDIDAGEDDRAVFARIITHAESSSRPALPFAALVQAIALDPTLRGVVYAKNPLERDPANERVYAGLSHFDCVTFVESVLALSETVAAHEQGFDDYAAHLAALRYRTGNAAYCDRLHYFTDWIRNAVATGKLEDVTSTVAGGAADLAFSEQPQGLDYLSRHAAAIPALADDPSRRACVRMAEQALTASLARKVDGTPGFAYIPKADLPDVVGSLHGGDIVAWVAELPGLDVIHVGIIVRLDEHAKPGFAHASPRTGGVTVADDLLAYAKTLGGQRGLIVARPRAPAAASPDR